MIDQLTSHGARNQRHFVGYPPLVTDQQSSRNHLLDNGLYHHRFVRSLTELPSPRRNRRFTGSAGLS